MFTGLIVPESILTLNRSDDVICSNLFRRDDSIVRTLGCIFASFSQKEHSLNMIFLLLTDDSTRVTLDMIDGDPTSHYINASFIKV